MSDIENKSTKKTKIPAVNIVIGLMSFYLFYQAYSSISIKNYLPGIFFLVVGVLLLVAAYFTKSK